MQSFCKALVAPRAPTCFKSYGSSIVRNQFCQQTLFSFLNRPFFPLGFGYRLRFLLRLLSLLVFNRFPYISKSFQHCLSFLYIEINQLGYGLGTSPNQGGGNIRVLLAPYSAISRELSGAIKASLQLGLSHPLYTPQAYSLFPPLLVCLSLPLRLLPTYYHIVLFH